MSAERTPDAIVTVTDPGCGWLNSNDREHYAPRAHKVALWRESGAWAAKAANLPTFQRVRIVAYLRFRPGTRVRDANNWHPTTKAILDGIVREAKRLVPDDDHTHVDGPDHRVGPTLKRGERLRVDLHVFDLTNGESND